MRNLFILRGAPASGKSTWIEQNNLESYTLSADKIRLMYQSPVTNLDGTRAISQNNDKAVWELLFQLLEKRMEKGEFVIVDATHYKSTLITRYKDLIDKYRYRVNVVDFSNVSEEELLRRNSERDEFKRVPEDVIKKMVVALADETEVKKAYNVISPEEATEILNSPLKPVILDDSIDKVVVFGDIHGCYEPLKTYFKESPFNENTCYIFVGDYIDRGLQNKEVLEFLLTIYNKKNVILLEGNHECLHKDTEILTNQGWLNIADVVNNQLQINPYTYNLDTKQIELDECKLYHKKTQEKMIHIKTCNTEQIVSFNHEIVLDGKKTLAQNLLNMDLTNLHKKILPCASVNQIDYDIEDDWLRLITWVVCDGCLVKCKPEKPHLKAKYRIQFGLAEEKKITCLCKLLDSMNIHYTKRFSTPSDENTIPPQVICIYTKNADGIFKYFPKGKQFPEFFKNLSKRQANVVLQAIEQTDGHMENQRLQFSSNNKVNVDILNEMCVKNGICFCITTRINSGFKPGSILYACKITENWDWVKNQNFVQVVDYNDYSYCITTNNGTLITRFNGKTAITGNCWLRMYAEKDYNIKDYEKVNEYHDTCIRKVLAQLDHKKVTLEKQINKNEREIQTLKDMLNEERQNNPSAKTVFYQFEEVDVRDRNIILTQENQKLQQQLELLKQYIIGIKWETGNTRNAIEIINKWYKLTFNEELSYDIVNLLEKQYPVVAAHKDNPIKSIEFLKRTVPQIQDIDKAQLRQLCRKFSQLSYFEFKGKKFLITHAGVSCMPDIFTPTEEIIKGVGKYEQHEEVDKMFHRNNPNIVSIHGHRNTLKNPIVNSVDGLHVNYINLCSEIEYGEDLRVLEITYDKEDQQVYVCGSEFKNTVFTPKEEPKQETKSQLELLKEMTTSKWIQVKNLDKDVISLNFTREAFEKDRWNPTTCTARGLFVNKKNGDVVARSYSKFHNYNQIKGLTDAAGLKQNLKFPVIGYKKENGFLGLVSKYKGEIYFFTKSSDSGDYVNWFIGALCDNYDIYTNGTMKNTVFTYSLTYNHLQVAENSYKETENSEEKAMYASMITKLESELCDMKQKLVDKLQPMLEEGFTYIFECVDPENDPHIIKYDKGKVILLDAVENTIEEENFKPYDKLCFVAKCLNVPVKEQELEFNSWEEFEDWKTKFSEGITSWNCKHEGYVFCDANNFRVKFKSRFYKFWKQMRGLKDILSRGAGNKKIYKTKEEIQIVKLMESIPKEELKRMSIIDIEDKFYETYEG